MAKFWEVEPEEEYNSRERQEILAELNRAVQPSRSGFAPEPPAPGQGPLSGLGEMVNPLLGQMGLPTPMPPGQPILQDPGRRDGPQSVPLGFPPPTVFGQQLPTLPTMPAERTMSPSPMMQPGTMMPMPQQPPQMMGPAQSPEAAWAQHTLSMQPQREGPLWGPRTTPATAMMPPRIPEPGPVDPHRQPQRTRAEQSWHIVNPFALPASVDDPDKPQILRKAAGLVPTVAMVRSLKKGISPEDQRLYVPGDTHASLFEREFAEMRGENPFTAETPLGDIQRDVINDPERNGLIDQGEAILRHMVGLDYENRPLSWLARRLSDFGRTIVEPVSAEIYAALDKDVPSYTTQALLGTGDYADATLDERIRMVYQATNPLVITANSLYRWITEETPPWSLNDPRERQIAEFVLQQQMGDPLAGGVAWVTDPFGLVADIIITGALFLGGGVTALPKAAQTVYKVYSVLNNIDLWAYRASLSGEGAVQNLGMSMVMKGAPKLVGKLTDISIDKFTGAQLEPGKRNYIYQAIREMVDQLDESQLKKWDGPIETKRHNAAMEIFNNMQRAAKKLNAASHEGQLNDEELASAYDSIVNAAVRQTFELTPRQSMGPAGMAAAAKPLYPDLWERMTLDPNEAGQLLKDVMAEGDAFKLDILLAMMQVISDQMDDPQIKSQWTGLITLAEAKLNTYTPTQKKMATDEAIRRMQKRAKLAEFEAKKA
ncbi:MAG: hypothetical protein GX552_15605, partial [Chloroflexi bacterium]|nr:hypothetical protein [Chloroflexota bacterium]